MKKYTLTLLAVLFSAPLMAHSGHGSEQPLVHSVEHALWVIAAVAAVVFVSFRWMKKEKRLGKSKDK